MDKQTRLKIRGIIFLLWVAVMIVFAVTAVMYYYSDEYQAKKDAANAPPTPIPTINWPSPFNQSLPQPSPRPTRMPPKPIEV